MEDLFMMIAIVICIKLINKSQKAATSGLNLISDFLQSGYTFKTSLCPSWTIIHKSKLPVLLFHSFSSASMLIPETRGLSSTSMSSAGASILIPWSTTCEPYVVVRWVGCEMEVSSSTSFERIARVANKKTSRPPVFSWHASSMFYNRYTLPHIKNETLNYPDGCDDFV